MSVDSSSDRFGQWQQIFVEDGRIVGFSGIWSQLQQPEHSRGVFGTGDGFEHRRNAAGRGLERGVSAADPHLAVEQQHGVGDSPERPGVHVPAIRYDLGVGRGRIGPSD